MSIRELRSIVRDVIVEELNKAEKPPKKPAPATSNLGWSPIEDDPAYDEASLLVSDEAKAKVNKWLKDMGLSRRQA